MDVECTNYKCAHFKLLSDDSVMVVSAGGEQHNWYKAVNGVIVEPWRQHRIGSPAIEYRGEGLHHDVWCEDGNIHRTDGPAIAYPDEPTMTGCYYLKGVAFPSEEEWLKAKKEAA